jgi:general secretion pathway protein K
VADHSERGVALLVVLLAIALLTVVVLEFTYRAQVEYRRAIAGGRVRQARLIADSGLAIAAEMLARGPLLYSLQYGGEEKTADGLGEMWAQRCEGDGPSICPANIGRSCTLDTFDANRLALRIRDENGLYNLNRLVNGAAAERERFAAILARAAIPPETLGGIVDWTARSSRGTTVPLPQGPDGRGSVISYPVRGGPLESFGELAFVPGVRAADLIELRRFATVLPPAETKINVNTAPLELLASLHPDLADQTVLSQLHAARCARPFADAAALRTALGESRKLAYESLLMFRSEHFRVEATGEIDDFYQSVEALLRRPYPAEGEPGNRTEWPVTLEYYLPRRGPLIDPAAMSAQSALGEFTGETTAPGGLL